MSKSMTDKRVIYALLGVVALCFLGIGFSLYRARLERLQALEGRLKKLRGEFAEMQAKIEQRPELEARYVALAERLSSLETGLPSYAYIPTFLRQLESLAGRTSNDVLRIQPKPMIWAGEGEAEEDPELAAARRQSEPETTESATGKEAKEENVPYNRLPIEVRLRGRYWTAISFLEELRHFPKMIAVNDLGFQPTEQNAQQREPELAITLDLTAVIMEGGKKWEVAAKPSSSP